ncbi:MAG: hypothetical protein AABY86_00950 [Bdellovibrionota bacterium]
MQILIVNQDKIKGDELALLIAQELQSEAIVRTSVEDAIGFLEILQNIGMVITKDVVEGAAASDEVAKYLKKNKIDIDLICLGPGSKETYAGLHVLPQKVLSSQVIEFLKKEIPDFSNLKSEKQTHLGLGIQNFEYVAQAPADIYVALAKNSEREKFIKVIKGGDSIDMSYLKGLQQKGVELLYIEVGAVGLFTKRMLSRFESLVEDLKTSNDSVVNIEEIHSSVCELLTNIGISDSAVHLAQKTAEVSLQKVKSIKGMGDLMAKVQSTTGGFKYKQSYLTSLLAMSMLDKSEWAEETHKQYIVTACFFNDLLLTTPEQIKIRTEEALEQSSFSRSDRNLISNHAAEAARKLEGVNGISSEVVKIVKGHHGSIHGNGFFSSAAAQITPLTGIFIIAESFAVELMCGGNTDVDVLAQKYVVFFKSGVYQKAIDCLKSVVGK